MDEQVKKAFEIANYMTSLASQKKVLLDEYEQNIIYFHNGATFKANRELINFVKTLIDLGLDTAVVIDFNNLPVDIGNTHDFLNALLDKYASATNLYHTKYQELKSKRSVESLTSL